VTSLLDAARIELLRRRAEPSLSVPCLDCFASPHGRLAAFDSALVSVHEGRGQEHELERTARTNPAAGAGSTRRPAPGVLA
jgi:hypothetical protein